MKRSNGADLRGDVQGREEQYILHELKHRRTTAVEATRNLIHAVGGWLVAVLSWLAWEVQT